MDLFKKSYLYACISHKGQLRKDGHTPFILHPFELVEILLETNIDDDEILSAALLHDVIEDTIETESDMIRKINNNITNIVLECSDDKDMSKSERKLAQISHSPHISQKAKIVKLADKLANLNSIITSPPSKWNEDRIIGYIVWSYKVTKALMINLDDIYAKQAIIIFDKHTEVVMNMTKEYDFDLKYEDKIFSDYLNSLS